MIRRYCMHTCTVVVCGHAQRNIFGVRARELSHLPFAINSVSRANKYMLRTAMPGSHWSILLLVASERLLAKKRLDNGPRYERRNILKRVNTCLEGRRTSSSSSGRNLEGQGLQRGHSKSLQTYWSEDKRAFTSGIGHIQPTRAPNTEKLHWGHVEPSLRLKAVSMPDRALLSTLYALVVTVRVHYVGK